MPGQCASATGGGLRPSASRPLVGWVGRQAQQHMSHIMAAHIAGIAPVVVVLHCDMRRTIAHADRDLSTPGAHLLARDPGARCRCHAGAML